MRLREATANDVTQLPPELLRKGRWDDLFFVDLPNLTEREAIWRIQFERHGRDWSHFDTLAPAKASEGYNGAEIEQACIDALYAAFACVGWQRRRRMPRWDGRLRRSRAADRRGPAGGMTDVTGRLPPECRLAVPALPKQSGRTATTESRCDHRCLMCDPSNPPNPMRHPGSCHNPTFHAVLAMEFRNGDTDEQDNSSICRCQPQEQPQHDQHATHGVPQHHGDPMKHFGMAPIRSHSEGYALRRAEVVGWKLYD